MPLQGKLRAAVAAACTVAFVATPCLVPTASAAVRAEAAIQAMTIQVTKTAINIRGARGLDAGRVKVDVRGVAAAEILMFDRGYDYRDFKRDVTGSFRGDMVALRRAIRNTEFFGGFDAGESGTVVLPRAGEYTIFAFGRRGPGPHETLTVGRGKAAPAPAVDGRIIARSGPKWGGSTHLPAKGRFLFKNADRTIPHFVVLQQVKEGTTIEQVETTLKSDEQGPRPDWLLPAGMETATLSPGRKMTVDYDLPSGQYVVMCFFPDPRMDGMPHALMGMLKMIHLM